MKHALLDSLILGIEGSICYISDRETYDLVHMTKGAMDLYGLTDPSQYEGAKCHKLLQDLDEPCSFCTNAQLCAGEHVEWEHFNDRLGRWMRIRDTLVNVDGRMYRLEVATDITDEKNRFERLADQLSTEDALVKCIHMLVSERDMDQAVDNFLETIARFHRAHRSYVFEFDFDANTISNTFEWCSVGVTSEKDNLQGIPMEYIDDWIEKFEQSGEFYITSLVADRGVDSPDFRILEAQGIESLMAAPLVRDGRIVGFLGVDDPEENMGDLTLLRASADFVLEELTKRRLTKDLERASSIDLLTGTYNRNRYMKTLEDYCARTPESLGIVFVDVNGMKDLNDTCGHARGDEVIAKVARMIACCVGGEVFRVGGDEFVVLWSGVSRTDFAHACAELCQTFAGDSECDVSVGSAWEERPADVNAQVQVADKAMYDEKRQYYQRVLDQGRVPRSGLMGEVVREVEDGRYTVFYQPQVNLRTGEVVGAEALVRKRATDGSYILPNQFIPLYEDHGVIRHVDLFVMDEACAALSSWRKRGLDLRMSVNMSRMTLSEPNIVAELVAVCERRGINPSLVTIEMAESACTMRCDRLRSFVDEAEEAGFNIALDDYGAESSNLSMLSSLDFDEVKFDRQLVESMEDNEKSRIIVRNSIRMFNDMSNVLPFAEGVETQAQADLLSEYDCEFCQGFLYSRPVPQREFEALLDKGAVGATGAAQRTCDC